jgi:peptide/nickel transport system substrate-binding protein
MRRAPVPLRRLEPRLSRRGLLAAGVLAGVLAATGIPTQARPRGGLLRLAVAGPLPAEAGWDTTRRPLAAAAGGLVAETLTEIGPGGELLPGLAVSWDSDGTASDWLLRLDAEARFHDGTRVAPEDVAASLRLHGGRYAAMGWLMGRVAGLRADGPGALRVTLREPDPDLPLHLAELRLVVWRGGRPDGVGTGLYRIDADAPAGVLRARRVAGHRRDGAAGFFDAVELRSRPDPAARLAALLGGEADAVDWLPPAEEARACAAGLAVISVVGPRQLHARLPRRVAADDAAVSGLSSALDREALAAAWGGAPASDHPLGPFHAAPSNLLVRGRSARAVEWMRRRWGLDPSEIRLEPWQGAATEEATLELALRGPWHRATARRDFGPLRDAMRASQGGARTEARHSFLRLLASSGVAVALNLPMRTPKAAGLSHGPVSGLAALDGGRIAERWWWA